MYLHSPFVYFMKAKTVQNVLVFIFLRMLVTYIFIENLEMHIRYGLMYKKKTGTDCNLEWS